MVRQVLRACIQALHVHARPIVRRFTWLSTHKYDRAELNNALLLMKYTNSTSRWCPRPYFIVCALRFFFDHPVSSSWQVVSFPLLRFLLLVRMQYKRVIDDSAIETKHSLHRTVYLHRALQAIQEHDDWKLHRSLGLHNCQWNSRRHMW